jgi:hypothetical protein
MVQLRYYCGNYIKNYLVWDLYCVYMGEIKMTWRTTVWNRERGNTIWGLKSWWKQKVKVSLQQGGSEVLNWITLRIVKCCLQRKDPLGFYKSVNFLNSGMTTRFSKRNLLHGINLLVLVIVWAFSRDHQYFDMFKGRLYIFLPGRNPNRIIRVD